MSTFQIGKGILGGPSCVGRRLVFRRVAFIDCPQHFCFFHGGRTNTAHRSFQNLSFCKIPAAAAAAADDMPPQLVAYVLMEVEFGDYLGVISAVAFLLEHSRYIQQHQIFTSCLQQFVGDLDPESCFTVRWCADLSCTATHPRRCVHKPLFRIFCRCSSMSSRSCAKAGNHGAS